MSFGIAKRARHGELWAESDTRSRWPQGYLGERRGEGPPLAREGVGSKGRFIFFCSPWSLAIALPAVHESLRVDTSSNFYFNVLNHLVWFFYFHYFILSPPCSIAWCLPLVKMQNLSWTMEAISCSMYLSLVMTFSDRNTFPCIDAGISIASRLLF